MNKIEQIQTILGVTADGKWGPKSQAALEEEVQVKVKVQEHVEDAPAPTQREVEAVDDRSAKNIATLLPPVRPFAVKLLLELRAAGIAAKIISGNRTYEEQNALYAQGRDKHGQVVTNARGGYSNHNFGVAFDIGIFDANGRYWDESPAYAKAGAIGKKLGLAWGGDWQFQDEPHFEWRPDWAKNLSEGNALAAYRERKEAGTPIA